MVYTKLTPISRVAKFLAAVIPPTSGIHAKPPGLAFDTANFPSIHTLLHQFSIRPGHDTAITKWDSTLARPGPLPPGARRYRPAESRPPSSITGVISQLEFNGVTNGAKSTADFDGARRTCDGKTNKYSGTTGREVTWGSMTMCPAQAWTVYNISYPISPGTLGRAEAIIQLKLKCIE
jgi:hypothetical protein